MKGYRTVLVNVAIVLAAIFAAPEMQAALPENWAAWALAGSACINIILRSVTTTPMGRNS